MMLSLLFVAGWFGDAGNGHKVHNQRALKDFTRIVTHGDIDIEIGEGDGYVVDVFIDDNLQGSVITEVKDGTLNVSEKSMLRWHGNAKISITLPTLASAETSSSSDLCVATRTAHDVTLTTSGSGDVSFNGPVKNLNAQTHGSGDYTITIFDNAEKVTLRTHGSGDFLVSGKAKALDVQSMGSGDVDARKLEVAHASADLFGSGDLDAWVTEQVTHVALHGSGDFTLFGKAKLADVTTHGSGEVRHH